LFVSKDSKEFRLGIPPQVCLNRFQPYCRFVIDIHCHVLPEVDDGAKSWEVAQEMCRLAADDGIEHIVATPHANDRFRYERQYLAGEVEHLRRLIGHTPQLSLGCDFHLSYGNLQNLLARSEHYTIEGSHYLLVELSNSGIPQEVEDWFKQITGIDLIPVITHPERNPILQHYPQRILGWVELGCAIQVTASALTGDWGERAWRTAQWLLKQRAVHVLASDAHDAKYRRPVLSSARSEVAYLCGDHVARALVKDNPRAIIRGEPLPYFPDLRPKG
jgi:protein-tyrosine phosphatase